MKKAHFGESFIKYLITLLLIALPALALKSPSASSLGLSIPNCHQVDQNLYRGMGPTKDQYIQGLLTLSVSNVLIFKNQTINEVDKEIAKRRQPSKSTG